MKQPQIPIVRLLKTNSDITDIVGSRIFPLQAPPGSTLPMILYGINENDPQDSKDGRSTLDVYEMQITILNQNYADIVRLANEVRSQLDYTKEYTYGGITLQLVYFIDEIETFDKDMDQSGTFIKTQTYGIRIKNI